MGWKLCQDQYLHPILVQFKKNTLKKAFVWYRKIKILPNRHGLMYLFSREMLRFNVLIEESRMAERFAANVASCLSFVDFQMITQRCGRPFWNSTEQKLFPRNHGKIINGHILWLLQKIHKFMSFMQHLKCLAKSKANKVFTSNTCLLAWRHFHWNGGIASAGLALAKIFE